MISPSFSILGLQIHWYGLLVALSIVTAWQLIIHRAQQVSTSVRQKDKARSVRELVEQSLVWMLIGGFIGARLWHVLTDWWRYVESPLEGLYVWNGGMSIVGGVVGGLVGWFVFAQLYKLDRRHWWLVPDLVIFGLPFAQAIGRLGNFINQELYGVPTSLPWGLYIDPSHRLPGFESISWYHPLFAYEALGMLMIGTLIWVLGYRHPEWIGTGRFVAIYLTFYSLFRFSLDFFRIDRGLQVVSAGSLSLGVNQLVLFLVALAMGAYWIRTWRLSANQDEETIYERK